MKKIAKLIGAFVLTSLLVAASSNLEAQGPDLPPADPSSSGTNGAVGHAPGGGAPLDKGAIPLVGMVVAYGAYAGFNVFRKMKQRSTAGSGNKL